MNQSHKLAKSLRFIPLSFLFCAFESLWLIVKTGCIFIALFCLTAVQSQGSGTTYLPVNHRAYDFLERMEHHFFITGAHLGTRPMTRVQVAQLLIPMRDKKNLLTPADREEYLCLLNEFSPDILLRTGLVWDDAGPYDTIPGFLKGFLYRNRRNFFSTTGDGYSLYFDPVFVRSAEISSSASDIPDDRVYVSGNGFILRGTAGDHIGYYVDVRDSKEWGSREYPETKVTTMPGRGYVSFKGDRVEFDETEAHVSYSSGPFVVSYGRGKNIWGRGSSGTLGLSGYASPYDMVRIEAGFWRLLFMFFTAEIEQFPPLAQFYYTMPEGVAPDSVTVKKYMSGHRLEMDFTNRFSMGFYETVIYGGRLDMSYLNPVAFLRGAEHSNGDHDNAALGLDFRLFVHRSHSIYGELFIDDISTRKLGTDWYGNKFGYQIGTFLVEPFGLKDIDVRAEYTRIKPWVYTHKFPIDGYNHYDDVLGYYSGPNSDVMVVQLRKRFTRRLHSLLTVMKYRHGANPEGRNIGGDPLQGFRVGYSTTKSKFLDGIVEKRMSAGVDVSYELAWQLFLRVGYTYEDRDGAGVSIARFSLGLNE